MMTRTSAGARFLFGMLVVAAGTMTLGSGAEAQVIHGMPFWAQPYPAYYAHRIGGDRPVSHIRRHRRSHRGHGHAVLHAKD